MSGPDLHIRPDAAPAASPVVVSVRALCKSFGSNHVLQKLSLDVGAGEFIGLMGPNGAGKSTLIKILDGVYDADSGSIEFEGRRVRSFAKVREVGFVHQDLGIVDDLTVVENLRLGLPPLRAIGPVLSLRRERVAAVEALRRVGLDLPLNRPAGDLSPGEKALLAVARLLSTGARFLVIDEATSTLPPTDARRFIGALRELTATGATVLFVSHKLSEVRSACNRAVLLLDGVIAFDEELDATNEEQLTQLLGESTSAATAPRRRPRLGQPVFELRGAHFGDVGPIDLVVHHGEVLGLTGLVGSGLHEIGYVAAGHSRLRRGERIFHGRRSALVAPQRETEGSIIDLSVAENLTLSALRDWRRLGLLALRRERRDARNQVAQLDVRPPDPTLTLGSLSGGNQQKVLFGRALATGADLLVICEPTRGVDLATRRALYALIHDLAERGVAILVITSDAEDLFAVCDRVGVLHRGRVRGPWPPDEMDAESKALVL